MEYPQNQRNRLRGHFRGYPYYKLCCAVYGVVQGHAPAVVLSPEQLFADAATTLDTLLTDGDFETERCRELWRDTLDEYRTRDGSKTDQTAAQAEVAMLFYAVMFGLAAVPHPHYRGKLQRTLHGCIHRMWGKENCEAVERLLPDAVDPFTESLQAWMADYFSSSDSLTEEIGRVAEQEKAKKTKADGKKKRKKDSAPPTFPYEYYDKSAGVQRIEDVMQILQHLKWIEPPRNADDFHQLFSGKPRACNIRWKETANVLSALTKALLQQSYMKKKRGDNVSISAIVTGQFGKKRSTMEPVDSKRRMIALIVKTLDVTQPRPDVSHAAEDDEE